ncbi:MAG: hypothetical protein IVW56_00305 [Candidatus Binataceae bacterium]|nr:hypothetical protein [Candidatus Binataceae bacterium]
MKRRRTIRTTKEAKGVAATTLIQKLRSQNRELRKENEALTARAERQETRAIKALKHIMNLKHDREQWESRIHTLQNEKGNLIAKMTKYDEIEIPGLNRQIADLKQQIVRSQPGGWSGRTPMNVIEERQIPLRPPGVQGGLGGL